MLEKLKFFGLNRAIPAVILGLFCWITVRIILKIYDKLTAKAKLDATLRKILRIGVKFILMFISVIIILGSLGVSVSSLIATLSVVGVALSLAIQGFLSNVFGGLQIISNHPFQVGDYVEVAGQSGTVREVGLFYTKLDTPDQKLIQIPNSAIANSSITNYTFAEKRRVDVSVCISYDNDTTAVITLLEKLLGVHPLTLSGDELDPSVHISAYNESSITLTARAWCMSTDYWTVYFDLMDAIKPAFDKAGVKLGYPGVKIQMAEK